MKPLLRTLFSTVLAATLAVVCWVSTAQAHFIYFQPWVIHIVETVDGVGVIIRVPLPLEVLPSDWRGMDAGDEVLYARKIRNSQDQWDYLLDPVAVTDGATDLAAQLAAAYSVKIDGRKIEDKKVTRVLITPYHLRNRFVPPATRKRAFRI